MNGPTTALEAQLDAHRAAMRPEIYTFLVLACDVTTVHGAALTSWEARQAAIDMQGTCDPDEDPRLVEEWGRSLAITTVMLNGSKTAVLAVLRALIFDQPPERRPAIDAGAQQVLMERGLWVDVEAEQAQVQLDAAGLIESLVGHRMGAA
jgi:hypothetical protein